MFKILMLIFSLTLLVTETVKSQGCSDAGFCTIGNLKPDHSGTANQSSQKLSVILNNGIGDESVYVFTPGIQYDKRLNNKWAIQSKLTANNASGNLGKATGLGDVYFSAIYTPQNNHSWKSAFLFGTKIPLNGSNLKEGGRPLPMQYQSSLGTFDLIGGFTLSNERWLLAAGLQIPLTGTNKNGFLPVYWSNAAAFQYPSTNDLNRRADALLRADHLVVHSKKVNLHVGLLGIYHFGKDSYIDGSVSNKPIEIIGSDGLTLNGTFTAQFNIKPKLSLGLSGGVPFVVRDIRPDGLTRKFVLSPEIIFHF